MKLETFVIMNKDEESDRYNHFLGEIKKHNLDDFLNINYFNHCWKNDITPGIREKYCKSDWTMRKHGRNMVDKPLTCGEISLFLNHVKCLENIRKNFTDGYFLILESDAIFTSRMCELMLNKILKDINLINDCDIINIGEGIPQYFERNGYPKTNPVIIKNNKYYKENLNRCSESIIWKYSAVCKFLEYFEKDNNIDGPIDTKMDVLSTYVGGFNIFWPENYIVRQGSNMKLYKSTIR